MIGDETRVQRNKIMWGSRMLQRFASMVRSFFVTNEVVPPPPTPLTIMGMGCMSPVPVDPLTEMDQTVRGFASEGFRHDG